MAKYHALRDVLNPYRGLGNVQVDESSIREENGGRTYVQTLKVHTLKRTREIRYRKIPLSLRNDRQSNPYTA